MCLETTTRLGPWNGGAPGEHLVGHDAERVEIAPAVDLLAGRLLGAHVGRRPDGHALPGAARAALAGHRARDAEVREQRASGGLVEQHVLGLHVAVHHAGVAGRVERRGQVRHDAWTVAGSSRRSRVSRWRRLSPAISSMT